MIFFASAIASNLQSVHFFKNFFSLAVNAYTDFSAKCFQFSCIFLKFLRSPVNIHDHYHIKEVINDSLRNIQNINPGLRKISTYLCNNSYMPSRQETGA